MRNSRSSLRWVVLLALLPQTLLYSNRIRAQAMAGSRAGTLFQAIRSGNAAELQDLLSKGADANDSLDGYSALMAAALNGTVDEMRILIAHGAKVNDTTRRGISALWLAVPDWDKTNLLLEHGADLQQKVEHYGLLVKLAAMPGTVKMIRFLMDKGADPKKSAPDNFLMFNAASSGDTAILGLFIRSGCSINDTVSFGDVPLDAALNFRTFGTLKMLVDHGANVNFNSMTMSTLPATVGFTPLMNAAWSCDSLSCLYLLEHGADPNLRSRKGFTALMMLEQAEIDQPEMTLAMINHGARVSDKAPDGSDALYYAEKKGNTRSVSILKKYAAR